MVQDGAKRFSMGHGAVEALIETLAGSGTILLHTSRSSIVADDVLAWSGRELHTPTRVRAPSSGLGRRTMPTVLHLGP
jgi:hypothetical protein